MMSVQALASVWFILVALAGLLMLCVCNVLTSYRRHHLEIHNRILASKKMRVEYIQHLAERGQMPR